MSTTLIPKIGAVGSLAQWNPTNTALVDPVSGASVTTLNIGITDLAANANQQITANTNTTIVWHLAVEDALGTWSAGDPTKIIVPAGANAMRVYGHLEWSAALAATGSYRSARMFVNGVSPVTPYTSGADVRLAVGTITDHQSVAIPLCRCTPGDDLTISVRHNDTTTPAVSVFFTSAVRFMVEWLKII